MKSVSLREFQLNASKYLEDLPVQLTRYNVPVAVVLGYKEGIMPEGFKPKEAVFVPDEETKGAAKMSALQDPNKCSYVKYVVGSPFRCTKKPLANGRCEDHQ